jgi:hypothetical protein
MKEQIREILWNFVAGEVTDSEAVQQVLNLFAVSGSVCQCKVNRMIVRHEDKDWCNSCGKLVKAN